MCTPSNTVPTKPAIFLPDEIIFYVLRFLNPREVIRLRLVSKQFSNVTRDARLWRALYINSRLPRPPGPFLWQSAQFLEHVLFHSARVSQTWTSEPMSVISRVRGPRIPVKPFPVSTSSDFLFGRLFIWCEGGQLLAQDLETGVGRLLYESAEPISSLSACSVTFPDSERIFIALRHVDMPVLHRTPIKLLEFPLQDDVRLTLGPVAFEIDLPECANFRLSASAHLLYFDGSFDGGIDRLFGSPHEPIVMDARSRAIYKFPTFSSSIDAVVHTNPSPWWPVLTLLSGEHIVVFRPWYHQDHPMTLVQAFVAPESPEESSDAKIGQLRLTHEVLVEQCYAPAHCLRGAILDPTTGETNVRFLSGDSDRGQTYYRCIDVTIPPVSSESTEVLPLLVDAQELFVLSGRARTIFLGASNDGHGRGIVTLSMSEPPETALPDALDDGYERGNVTLSMSELAEHGYNPLVLYKFSVDASEDHCAAVVSEPSTLNWHDMFQYRDRCVFDGIRGRFCHDREARSDFYDLVVLSLN